MASQQQGSTKGYENRGTRLATGVEPESLPEWKDQNLTVEVWYHKKDKIEFEMRPGTKRDSRYQKVRKKVHSLAAKASITAAGAQHAANTALDQQSAADHQQALADAEKMVANLKKMASLDQQKAAGAAAVAQHLTEADSNLDSAMQIDAAGGAAPPSGGSQSSASQSFAAASATSASTSKSMGEGEDESEDDDDDEEEEEEEDEGESESEEGDDELDLVKGRDFMVLYKAIQDEFNAFLAKKRSILIQEGFPDGPRLEREAWRRFQFDKKAAAKAAKAPAGHGPPASGAAPSLVPDRASADRNSTRAGKQAPAPAAAPASKPNAQGSTGEGEDDEEEEDSRRSTGDDEAYTVTFGDRAENEAGMQIIGTPAAQGVSVEQLKQLEEELVGYGVSCELHDLGQLLEGHPEGTVPAASVLVIRDGVDAIFEDAGAAAKVLSELQSMPKDTTSLSRYGKVVNKHARHNNTMGDFNQEPDIANGKGTVVDFKDYPMLGELRNSLTEFVNAPTPLVGELNHYFDSDKCGIGWHGDAERKIVVGVRLGAGADGLPLKYQWFKNSHPLGPELRIDLNAGDMYIMSEKAVGFDFKKSSILTLRHAAGKDSCKYARPKPRSPAAKRSRDAAMEAAEQEEEDSTVSRKRRKTFKVRGAGGTWKIMRWPSKATFIGINVLNGTPGWSWVSGKKGSRVGYCRKAFQKRSRKGLSGKRNAPNI